MNFNNALMSSNKKPLSNVLNDVTKQFIDDRVYLYEIAAAMQEQGFAVLMLIFALPLSIPLPVPPGFTTILAIPLFLFSIQIVCGFKAPSMPGWIGKRSIRRSMLASIVEKIFPLLRKLEKISKARLFYVHSFLNGRIFGIMSLLYSISIALPIPLTNFIPAIGIVLMSLGLLNKDGLLLLLGIIVGCFGLFVSCVVIILGPKFIMKLLPVVNFWK